MCIVLTYLQLLEAMLSVWKQGWPEKLDRKMCQEYAISGKGEQGIMQGLMFKKRVG